MLKRMSIRKILASFAALFAMLLIYLIPDSTSKLNPPETLKYVNVEENLSKVFLLDKDSFVALTEVSVSEEDIEKKALELIKILTIGESSNKLPSGFSSIIPPDTEVLNITYDHDVLKIDFSKELLDISKDLEEKMIESIVYTLTSIDKVDKIIIYVEGDILTKLPKSKINLPSTLDKSFGINKEFNLTSTKDITDVTVYYINQINENYYYVPVTKYLNDSRDKISIIIEELSTGFNPNYKLMSYMDNSVKMVSSIKDDSTFKLEMDGDIANDDILQKVDDTVYLSVCANYDVDKVKINDRDKSCK